MIARPHDPCRFGAELAELAVAEIQAAALTIAEATAKADRLADIVPHAHAAISLAAVGMVGEGLPEAHVTAWQCEAHAAFVQGIETARTRIDVSERSEIAP